MWSKTWRLKRKKLVRENEETYIRGREENATGYTRRWKGSGFCGALLGELMIVLSQDASPCIWSQAWRNSTQKGLFSLWTYSLAHGLFTLNIYGDSFTCRRMCPYVFSNNDDGLERWWQMWDVWCRGGGVLRPGQGWRYWDFYRGDWTESDLGLGICASWLKVTFPSVQSEWNICPQHLLPLCLVLQDADQEKNGNAFPHFILDSQTECVTWSL